MCSCFEMSASFERLAARFGLRAAPPRPPGKRIRPADQALAITVEGGCLLSFGLRVDWGTGRVLNARAETLDRRSTFRPLLERRCLLPATAWIEWQAPPHGGRRKRRWRLAPPDGSPLFAMAGLTDGKDFVVLTRPAAPTIAFVHPRMPVILSTGEEALWLDPTRSFASLAALLMPRDGVMTARPDDADSPTSSDLFDRLPLSG